MGNTDHTNAMPMFAVLSSWNCHCKSSPGSCKAQHQTAADFLSFGQANQPEPLYPPIDSYIVKTFTIDVYYYFSA